MTGIWVDTDFGFDDLWALLLLRHLGCKVAGVSLVSGNAPLSQVVYNASAAKAAYKFDWPLWQGAERPLKRNPEHATRILGPTGMRSRGKKLDPSNAPHPPVGAIKAMAEWLQSPAEHPHEILALGPLTNIAQLLNTYPEISHRMDRLVWMGGSAGPGNHTPFAEFNALADPEALDQVAKAGLPFDIVDLTTCRTVTFGANDLPNSDPLTSDLIGGYLDIALERGRSEMAIYDPVAALAIAHPAHLIFQSCTVDVGTEPTETYGATRIEHSPNSRTRISTGCMGELSRLCLEALTKELAHVT